MRRANLSAVTATSSLPTLVCWWDVILVSIFWFLLFTRVVIITCRGTDITDARSADSEDLLKCEHPEMRHCCSYIVSGPARSDVQAGLPHPFFLHVNPDKSSQQISGVGIQCGQTRALECPVPGYERAKRHLRPGVPDGCTPPGKLGQATVDSPVAAAPVDLFGDSSLDTFLAEQGSRDGPMDQNLWSPTALDDGLTTISLGGGGIPTSTYGDGASSLALFDAGSAGGSPNMFMDG